MKKFIPIILLIITLGLNTSAQLANWTPGTNPAFTNFPVNVSGQINGFCRISQMKFHATDANKLYAVTGEGGFFASTDAGNNWAVKAGTENLAGGCASLCIDYTNDQVIYLGSGDANYYSNGQGIYKSTNGGLTFAATTLTNCLVIEILQDPNNPGTFVAATNKGIYKSINNGTTWTATTGTTIQFCDLKQNAAINSSILYASTRENSSRFFRSTDFGGTWTQITTGITTAVAFISAGGRIGVTPADPNVVYFEAIGGGGIIFKYKSNDGGLTFTVKKGEGAGTAANPYLTFYDFDNANGLAGQGNYNNCITVDVNNPAKIWLQSHNTWLSMDSGVTWTSLTYWAYILHTDMHQLTQSPYDASKLYSCNDGGVWVSTDGGTNWLPKSNGLYAYEIYNNCGKSSRTDRNNITIGTQDNGRVYRTANGWFTDRGGDNTRQKEYDYLPNGGNYYEKTQNIKRAAGGGATSSAGFTTSGNYWEYLAFNRSNTSLGFMWFTNNNLYRTTNLSVAPPTWDSVFTFTQPVRAIHSSIADVNRLYVITSDAKIHVSSNALSATPTFTIYNLPSASGTLASIAAIANNANTVYISINNRVYISTDAGATWVNITYNLPNVNHRKILAEEIGGTQELVFVATNNAVYYKKAGQTTWTNYSTNLPGRRAPTDFSMYDDGTGQSAIRYYSYGRGVMETPFANLRVLNAQIAAGAEVVTDCNTNTISFSDISTGTPVSYSWSFVGGTPATSSSPTPTVAYTANGTYNISLTITDASNNTSTQNISRTIQLLPKVISAVTVSANPAPSTFCIGSSVTLTANGGTAPAFAELGNGASVTVGNSGSSILGPNPLQNYYGGSKQLMLFTVQELNTLGLTTGAQLSGFGVNIVGVNTSYVLQNLQVKIQNTTLTSLTGFINSGWAIVRSAANYSLTGTGWNMIPFTANYTWNGTSNLLVEVTYSNNNTGSSGNTAMYGVTANTSTLLYRADNVTAASVDAYSGNPNFSYAARNNVRFSLANIATVYTWSPTTGLNTSSGSVVTANPPGTTTYTVTASSTGRCPVTETKTVTLNAYDISSSANVNGSISPNGVTNVNCGTNQLFTITANGGYNIQDVVVDGISQGAINTYTFNNVTATHTITANFISACVPNTWTGATNNLWSVPANWDCGSVPNNGDNVTIPDVTNDPVLDGNITVGNFSLAAGATLSIGSNTLTLNGAVSGTGTFTGSATSNLITNATTTVRFTTGANTLKNFNVAAGTATLGNALDITAGISAGNGGVVTVASGAILVSAGNLTFKSNQFGTARLAAGDIVGNYVTGEATVERYIPDNGFRSWRLLSVPTYGNGQTIRQAWQEGLVNTLPLQNNLPNFGTQITSTGVLATVQAAGFDNTAATAALLSWSGAAWVNAVATNTAIATNKGYFMFIRGERSKGVTGASTNSSATTLRTKGLLYQGNQTLPILPANGFNLIGNLYPSAISFTSLIRTGGANNIFYIWDSKKLNGNSLGVYQTFSATNGFNCLVGGGSYTLGQPNTIIESGQAFFVPTGGATGTITLTEASKVGSTGNSGFRPANTLVKIDSRLYKVFGGSSTIVDANVVVFDNAYSNTVDNDDALKLANSSENFGISTDNKIVTIEGRQPLNGNDVIHFNMWNMKQQHYTLEFVPTNLSTSGLEAMLQDNYLKTSTVVSLNTISSITFTVDANAASSAKDRFSLLFKKTGLLNTISEPGFTVSPNPADGNIVNVLFVNQPQGKYTVRLLSSNGQLISSKVLTHAGGNSTQPMALPENIASGTYQVEIISTDKTRATKL